MKAVLPIAFLVILSGCIGPATERLENLGLSEDRVRSQLVTAVQSGDETTAAALREVLASYKTEREQLMTEAAKERESVRERRSGLWGLIQGALGIVVPVAISAGKRALTGGIVG